MAKNKNKNKKKQNGAVAMDVSLQSVSHLPQAMDTTEIGTSAQGLGVLNRKIKKGVPMRKAKTLRKMKAIEKAISRSEKSEEKIMKSENKSLRTQSAKLLYD